jgi:NAD(P)-dependent dehydrogenase (short-subunit alcohol dehydrogenase family)
MTPTTQRIALFGSTGDIGRACSDLLKKNGYEIISIPRNELINMKVSNLDGAIWAQGKNITESFENTSDQMWDSIWDANFNYFVKTLNYLIDSKAFNMEARLVVVSSVWQEISRTNKSAYISSKAALGGLVRALASDLGSKNITINAVLPGVTDSKMTNLNLTNVQIESIRKATPTEKLVNLDQVASVIEFLVSKRSLGINGQSIIVDNGWSQTKDV